MLAKASNSKGIIFLFMLSKRTIQFLKSLKDKASRHAEGFFLVEGSKTAIEILTSNLHIEAIYATKEWCNIFPKYKNHAKLFLCTQNEIEQISSLKSTRDVIVQVAMKDKFFKYNHLKNDFTIVLDEIQDPGNLGTIIRIADWYGIKNIVCSENTADCYNNKCIQATMGSIARVNIFYENLVHFFEQNKLPVYGAFMEGTALKNATLTTPSILVIGNEGKGINENLQPFITQKISIKRFGEAESLNAAIATAIICDHFLNV
ncbi:MAG: RNA methyltransferase [Bacteroidia bacterium]